VHGELDPRPELRPTSPAVSPRADRNRHLGGPVRKHPTTDFVFIGAVTRILLERIQHTLVFGGALALDTGDE